MLSTLRSRIVLASVLWTGGMLFLLHLASVVLVVHRVPMPRGTSAIGPALLGVALMVLGFFTARGSLAPLLGLRGKVVAVRRGDAKDIVGVYPAEVQPLIDSLNELIADRERSIQRAHAVSGDLAHCLKTPLAVLAREAESARGVGGHALAEAIEEQIQRMASHVEYHLARARVAAAGSGGGAGVAPCAVAPCVAALVRTLSKLYAERGGLLAISTAEVSAEVTVRVRIEDLEEILGNVLDNACKWARARIRVAAVDRGEITVLTVEDDGPGLPEALRAAVLERGVRIDESAPGTGLGLSIVRELVEHYGGTVVLSASSLGGLGVQISLPKQG